MPPEEMINIFSPQQELNLPIHFPDLDFLMEEDPEDLDELDLVVITVKRAGQEIPLHYRLVK